MAGTTTVETTPNRGYQLPVLSNGLTFDLPRLRTSLNAIDGDVAALLLAIAGFADLDSPVFVGNPEAPTKAPGDDSSALATTAFVTDAVSGIDTSGFAPTVSPTFTGSPKAPTPVTSDSSTNLATTAFVKAVVNALVDAAPGALDTLNELAAALGDDPNFAATVTGQLALKAALASPAFTGTPTAPTQASGNSSTRIATTAFVGNALAGYAQFYSGSSVSNTSFPIGDRLPVFTAGGSYNRGALVSPCLFTDTSRYFGIVGNPNAGTALSGVWRCRAMIGNDYLEAVRTL